MSYTVLRVWTFALAMAFVSLSPLSIARADESKTSGTEAAPNSTTPAAIGVTESAPEATAPAASGATAEPSGTASAPEATAPAAAAQPSGAAAQPSGTASAPEATAPASSGAAVEPSGTAGTASAPEATAPVASEATAAQKRAAAVQTHAHASLRRYPHHYAYYPGHYGTAYGRNPVAAVVRGVFGGVADLGSIAAYPVYCFPHYGGCRPFLPY
jgi:hypothetical protein